MIVEEENNALLEAIKRYGEVNEEKAVIRYAVFVYKAASDLAEGTFMYAVNDGPWIEGVSMATIELQQGDRIAFKAIPAPCNYLNFWQEAGSDNSCGWNEFEEIVQNDKLYYLSFIPCLHGRLKKVEVKLSDCSTPGNKEYIQCEHCGAHLDELLNYHDPEEDQLPLDPDRCLTGEYDPARKTLTCPGCGKVDDFSEMAIMVLPTSLTCIQEDTFIHTAANVIVVPEDCKSISRGAFDGCEELLYMLLPEGTDYQIGEGETENNTKILKYQIVK